MDRKYKNIGELTEGQLLEMYSVVNHTSRDRPLIYRQRVEKYFDVIRSHRPAQVKNITKRLSRRDYNYWLEIANISVRLAENEIDRRIKCFRPVRYGY